MSQSTDTVTDCIVVPARYSSTRLPGKPLLRIAGRTLLERVVATAREAAALAGNCEVIVATDDQRIADHAVEIGAMVAMTPPELDSGTVRAAAAIRQFKGNPAYIVNLQGDAPFIPSSIVAEILTSLRHDEADVVTPVFRLDWTRLDRLRAHKDGAPFSGTTCIRAPDGRALWFSKVILPAMRNEVALRRASLSPVWQHLGLYGYTQSALKWFAAAPRGVYEALEGLEQLRFLESGWRIDTVSVDAPAHILSGIDTPEDIKAAEEAIARYGDPFLG